MVAEVDSFNSCDSVRLSLLHAGQPRRAGRALFVARSCVLEQQRGHRDADLVFATDRGRRELELAIAPIEETHQARLLRRDAVRAVLLDLQDLSFGDEDARDLAVAQEQQDSRFALELEEREQRAEADVDEAAA